ncbi:hypothetical protein [Companilactobacillus halodurans]|nr:hypothetical protein [Companilactobacillus halodurans]
MWATLLLVILVAGSAYGGYHVFNQSIQKQTYIRVNTFRAKPIVHFINMGLSGDGGYNEKDSFKMATTISKQARIDYSVHSIKKRLKKMGPFGYVKFLLQKQGNNSADGTFAWIKEGNFIHGSSIPKQHGVAGVIDNFIYLYGTNLGDFRFIAQIFWCICLGIIFFAWDDTRKITQIMRLTIIGGFIFLLIFEGGRSRYLIQFLPAFLILATLNFHATKQKLHDLFSWTKTSKD